MTNTITGTVTSKSRAGTGIQIDKGQWLNGTAAQLASINWKDSVTAEVEGKKILSISLAGGNGGNAVNQSAGGGSYMDRQNAIEWQSSRRDAISLVANMVSAGVAPMPTAKADKYDHYLALVDTITMQLYQAEVPEKAPAED